MNFINRYCMNGLELKNFIQTVLNTFIYDTNLKNISLQDASDILLTKQISSDTYTDILITPTTKPEYFTYLPTSTAAISYFACSCNPLEDITCSLSPQNLTTQLKYTKSSGASGINKITLSNIALSDKYSYKLIEADLDGHQENSSLNKKTFVFNNNTIFGTKGLELEIPLIDSYTFILTPDTENCRFSPANVPVDFDGSGGNPAKIGIKTVRLTAARKTLSADEFELLAKGFTEPTIVKAEDYTTNINGTDYKCICFDNISLPEISKDPVEIDFTDLDFWSYSAGSTISSTVPLTQKIKYINVPNSAYPYISFSRYGIDASELPTLNIKEKTIAPMTLTIDLKQYKAKVLNNSGTSITNYDFSYYINNKDLDYVKSMCINYNYYYDYAESNSIPELTKYDFSYSSETNIYSLNNDGSFFFNTFNIAPADTTYNIYVNNNLLYGCIELPDPDDTGNAYVTECFSIKSDEYHGVYLDTAEDSYVNINLSSNLPIIVITDQDDKIVENKDVYLHNFSEVNFEFSNLLKPIDCIATKIDTDSNDPWSSVPTVCYQGCAHGILTSNINIVADSYTSYQDTINDYTLHYADYFVPETDLTWSKNPLDIQVYFDLYEYCTYETSTSNSENLTDDSIFTSVDCSSNSTFTLEIQQYDYFYSDQCSSSVEITFTYLIPPMNLATELTYGELLEIEDSVSTSTMGVSFCDYNHACMYFNDNTSVTSDNPIKIDIVNQTVTLNENFLSYLACITINNYDFYPNTTTITDTSSTWFDLTTTNKIFKFITR